METVTVIIPTKNRHGFLRRALQSVYDQTYPEIEVIIIDDCSDVPVAVDSPPIPGRTVRVIKNQQTMGGAYSRKYGTELANGGFICFLDDDDTYFDNKIESLKSFLDKNKEADAVFGRVIRSSGRKKRNKHLSDGCRISNIRAISGLHTNGSLIRRHVFETVNFDPSFKKYQDTQFHIEIISSHSTYYIDCPVAQWNDEYVGDRITAMDDRHKIINSLKSSIHLYEYFARKDQQGYDVRRYLKGRLIRNYAKHWAHVRHDIDFQFNTLENFLIHFFFVPRFLWKQRFKF